MEEVRIEKLVHGGQGLGTLSDGRKIFVWNTLPGEVVRARIIKKKHSYVEAIAEEILVASNDRTVPQEDNYLATSPWQIMTYEAENKYKREIVRELFEREKIHGPDIGPTLYAPQMWEYRNKMEYSFWGDDDGLHLALHQRGSHGKHIVTGSRLAMPALDRGANAVLSTLSNRGERAGNLKTIIVRCNQNGDCVASLFVKSESFEIFDIPSELQGLRIYYSNPKSPASVPTRLLHEVGDVTLLDQLQGKPFMYDVDSFFQVNVPIFEQALDSIKRFTSGEKLVDMYAGVGSIGLSVASRAVQLIELDPHTAAMARVNITKHEVEASVIEASTEKALDYIKRDIPIIFDPPRAGLHDKVVERILDELPPKITYLSCNPATHARDLGKLQSSYKISAVEVYNFFPRTPHIESLAMLERKN